MSVSFTEQMQKASDDLRKRRGLPPSDKPIGRVNGDQIDLDGLMRVLHARMDEKVNDVNRAIRDDLNAVIENVLDTVREHRVVLTQPNQVDRTLDGLTHKHFETLLRACSVRDWKGNRKNVLVKGPMGGGKSTACKQVAEMLDLSFGYIGQTNMPHIVVGSAHPISNEYRHTAFTNAFINGGIIVLEEMDAWNPNASLVLNAPLANGWLTLENGERYERHTDCIIIACANTWGTGATAEYVGRNKMDAAFLDRFAIKMMWDYDDKLERMAANNDEVVDAIQRARFNAEHYGLKVAISPRSSIDIADMVRQGFDLKTAMNLNFLAGCDAPTKAKLLEDIDL